jgi:hypothetical protein
MDAGGYNYTLHNNETVLIEKIDELLEVGGRVLLGPDVDTKSGAGKNSYSTLEFWNNLILQNKILKNKYNIIKNFLGRSNMIIVLEKTK